MFKSIESIRLDKLDNSDQSPKKSPPPPGFEYQFKLD